MLTGTQIEKRLAQTKDQASFFGKLLGETLGWPTADAVQIEDIAYGWSQEDLNAAGLERHLVEGSVWQIQPAAANQPWGIFVLQFKHEDALSPHRGMAGVLRKVLRGLVSTGRKDPKLPSWKRDHLLFICTHDWTSFRFAYYRPKREEPRSARLTTFGWSLDTPKQNRTVCEFNLPALVWPDDPSDSERWVATWAKAFDKEPLTKDFFRRFDKALLAIKADLEQYMELSSAAAYTQSQLLLERMIFLYFLENRGWLNRDRHYLRKPLQEHMADPEKFTYYKELLDRLFWTLSSAPGEAGRLPGVPFLNGGLFDDDEFRQPADLRKTTPPLKVRNRTMQYVFDELLEAFNFTVMEDTPLNQEVAVDPEMLGKVFESIVLYAEQADPDATAPDKRKATGSYYTPRIVVHFICREVLYQYLVNHLSGNGWGARLKKLFAFELTDGIDEDGKNQLKETVTPEQARVVLELVKPLKCCDPAVGSGAFPVGLMQELTNLRRLLETVLNGYRDPVLGPQGSSWLHDTKAEIVENCLYGVDIQQQAIEICRLRLWLSLVVDYDLGLDPFTAEHRQFNESINRISQLPNLEMNFRRGDSLHDRISGVPVVILPDRASYHAAEFAAIAKLGADLHRAKKAERKKSLRLDILQKRLELSRKIVDEELRLMRERDSAFDRLFGDEESDAEKRGRNKREMERLEEALETIGADQKQLDKLRHRDADPQFYPKLRKLEGADFDSPLNFAWFIDFPKVFSAHDARFDIIVGNPPFVTARNRTKRELWAERWPRVCYKNYQLVAPFFDLSFNLLSRTAELGFIVSNAFAKRDFGKPLVEQLFSTVDLQKVVDCSGLMFPGHGTPTCIVFGQRPLGAAEKDGSVRVTTILPGGGDLRTPPEDSRLWHTIESHHDGSGYRDERIDVSDRDVEEMRTWPWRVIADDPVAKLEGIPLQNLCAEPIGAQFITGKDEAFVVPGDYVRRRKIECSQVKAYGTGEDVRDWQVRPTEYIIFPYDDKLSPLREPLPVGLNHHLKPYRAVLEDCVVSSSIKKRDTNLKWFEFRRLARAKFRADSNIVIPQIATHQHFIVIDHSIAFKEKAQAIVLKRESRTDLAFLLTGVLNSSLFAEILKQECFSKRESDRPEKDTYFEFSGGKLASIGIPASIGQDPYPPPFDLIGELSERCHKLGKSISGLAMRKLFSLSGEAYHDLNSRLPAEPPNHPDLPAPFTESAQLRLALKTLIRKRHEIVSRMIGYQEEIDWLVYRACGLVDAEHPAVQVAPDVERLDPNDRPFRIWNRASGEHQSAIVGIPKDWPEAQRQVWQARLAVIRDNEQIRRIEQPLYKRRWDEQWKFRNQWRSGEIAYIAEFTDAFEWWLKEKAEWWLEHKRGGGPVGFEEWATALWTDERVTAAWHVAAEQYAFVEHEVARERAEERGEPIPAAKEPTFGFAGFARKFKQVIDEETVPDGLPFGLDYDELKKKLKKEIPAKLKSVRGKLNVPRERFHSVGRGQYKWAGLQFKGNSMKAGA